MLFEDGDEVVVVDAVVASVVDGSTSSKERCCMSRHRRCLLDPMYSYQLNR